MARRLAMAALLLSAGWLAGCSGMTGGKQIACNGCGTTMAEGAYCGKCQMLVVESTGMVHCDKCNMDMPAGKYCKSCNRFMLAGEAKCPGCGATLNAGQMCPHCKMYAGSKNVKYCEGCKSPCPMGQCPVCKA